MMSDAAPTNVLPRSIPSSDCSAASRAFDAVFPLKPASPKLPVGGIASGRDVAPVTYSVTPAVDVMTGNVPPVCNARHVGQSTAPAGRRRRLRQRRLPLFLLIRMRVEAFRPNARRILCPGCGLGQRSRRWRGARVARSRTVDGSRSTPGEGRTACRCFSARSQGARFARSQCRSSRRARRHIERIPRCRRGSACCCRRCRRTGRRRRAPCSLPASPGRARRGTRGRDWRRARRRRAPCSAGGRCDGPCPAGPSQGTDRPPPGAASNASVGVVSS